MLALVGSGEYLPPMEPVDRRLIERLGEPPPRGLPAYGRRARRGGAHRILERAGRSPF